MKKQVFKIEKSIESGEDTLFLNVRDKAMPELISLFHDALKRCKIVQKKDPALDCCIFELSGIFLSVAPNACITDAYH